MLFSRKTPRIPSSKKESLKKGPNKTFLGVHHEDPIIKLAKLKLSDGKIQISHLRTLPSKDGDIHVKPLYMLKSALEDKEFGLASGLEASDVFFRNIHVKLTDKRKILSTLPFQAEGLVPFSLNEAIIATHLTKISDSKTTKVTLFASKIAQVESHLHQMQQFDLDPELVSCTPNALVRYFHHFYPTCQKALYFHIGLKQSLALCFSEGELEISYPFPFGVQTFLQALERDLPEASKDEIHEIAHLFDFYNIDRQKFPSIYSAIFQFQREIDRLLSFFQTKPFCQTIKNVVLTGHFSYFSRFRDFFVNTLPQNYELLASPTLSEYDATTVESFAIPIGLALDALRHDDKSVQFRRRTFASPKVLARRIKALSSYALSCFALTALTLVLGQLYVQSQEKKLTKQLEQSFPQEMQKASLSDLSLVNKVSHFEKKFGKTSKTYPYLLTVPNVSDTLTWMSTHPMLTIQTNAEGKKENIEIKRVSYQLTKYPKLTSPSSPYVAQVVIEFTSSSTRLAREFHHALLKGDTLVDEKGEIGWHVHDSDYRVSFFLKPKKAGFS